MERPSDAEERNKKRKSLEIEENKEEDAEFFVYTSETKYKGFPTQPLSHLRFDSSVSVIPYIAFKPFQSLVHVQLPETLRRIVFRAFEGCYHLSHIRIPASVETIGENAFKNCAGLVSMELPERPMFHINIDGCWALMNVAGPSVHLNSAPRERGWFLRDSKLAEVAPGYYGFGPKLEHRFDDAPLNKLCYYHSYHSSEDVMVKLRSLLKDDPLAATDQVDKFGMTPLHVLSLSQTPNLDMLVTLINEGRQMDHFISGRDKKFGSTPLDYLCLNRSKEVVRRVLRARFGLWLVGSSGSSDESLSKSDTMRQKVEMALAMHGASSRSTEIGKVCLELAKYEQRMKAVSLVDLRLWKMKIDEVPGSKEQSVVDRESCRFNSGASIVIPHVLPFLDFQYK